MRIFESHTFQEKQMKEKHEKVYMIVGRDASLQPPGVRLRALTGLVVQFKS